MTPIEPQPDSPAAEESKDVTSTSPSQRKWIPTQQSFEKLLAAFHSDRDEAGKHYEKTRVKLLRYFERHEIADPDRHVDETLDRVMRRLDEGEVIAIISAYIYTVASYVRLEAWKQQEQIRKAESEIERTAIVIDHNEIEPNPLELCFETCLRKLPIETRKLIHDYYSEEGSLKIKLRKQMAQRLGIRLPALRSRAHKIRISLEACVRDCLSQFA